MQNISLLSKELLIFDLDGVIYKGPQIIPHVLEALNKFKALNKKIIYFTNNSTLTTKSYTEKMSKMGIKAEESQFYTSATISAKAMLNLYGENSSAFVIGESGLIETLEAQKIKVLNNTYQYSEIIENDKIKCDFVIAGLDRTLTYDKLAAGTQLISRRAEFYATNDDATLPHKFGNMPGAGTIISALSTAIGKPPAEIFGKPSPAGIEQILTDLSIPKEKAIMFGDRPETDILSAKRAGVNSALVLTGIITKKNQHTVPNDLKADIILNNLSEFAQCIVSEVRFIIICIE